MFIEKLNRKRNGTYTIEEQKQISDGTWEGILDHDNVMTDTISIYTGPKFTGDKIDNFIISTPSETPWKTYIRIFADVDVVYITYESLGDQVEADDINLLQDELVNEMNRSKDVESELDVKIDTETSRAKDIELNLGNKIDNEIQRSTTADATMDNKIDNEITRSTNMDNTVNSKINSEIERSQNVENALNDKIIQEIDRAKNQEQVLQSNITAEVSRSKKAEEDLNITIGNERTRAVGRETEIENNLNAHIDNYNLEIQRLDGVNAQLESNKADKVYVDTGLNMKYDKDQVFTKEEVLQKIQDVIGTAPEVLDTLEELARALDNDPNFATNIVNLLSTKVDKVDGKQLSANDFTDLLKAKLDKIEDGANKYIHPDKHNASMIVEDSTKRFVSDIEKADWNARETPSGAQTKADTAEDNAKAYTDVHDNNTIKHITATERTNWNDANSKKHTHSNKSILDGITQTLVDAWNSAVEHVKDTVRHITPAERTKWNSAVEHISDSIKHITLAERTKWNSKAEGIHEHTKGEITDFPTSLPADGGFADGFYMKDTRSVDDTPSDLIARKTFGMFKYRTSVGNPPVGSTATYVFIINIIGWSVSEGSGGYPIQIAVGKEGLAFRQGTSTTTWSNWIKIANAPDIPTKVSQLSNDKNYVTQAELGSAGYGDMMKSTYDKDNDGVVDKAKVADNVPWGGITGKPSTFTPSGHTHDDRYYTESETDTKLSTKSNVGHHHDDKYIGRGPITCDQLKGVW